MPSFYKHIPDTLYEKYDETWNYFHGSRRAKKQIQNLANNAWKMASDTEKINLVKKHISDISKRKFLKQASLLTFVKPVNNLPADRTESLPCNADVVNDLVEISAQHTYSVESLNASDACLSRDEYISSNENAKIFSFLQSFGKDHVELFDKTGKISPLLSKSLLDTAKSYNNISDNLKKYRTLQKTHEKNRFFSKFVRI